MRVLCFIDFANYQSDGRHTCLWLSGRAAAPLFLVENLIVDLFSYHEQKKSDVKGKTTAFQIKVFCHWKCTRKKKVWWKVAHGHTWKHGACLEHHAIKKQILSAAQSATAKSMVKAHFFFMFPSGLSAHLPAIGVFMIILIDCFDTKKEGFPTNWLTSHGFIHTHDMRLMRTKLWNRDA